ncbi:975_t:CDS:2, partial [Paraglomus brasilianum]
RHLTVSRNSNLCDTVGSFPEHINEVSNRVVRCWTFPSDGAYSFESMTSTVTIPGTAQSLNSIIRAAIEDSPVCESGIIRLIAFTIMDKISDCVRPINGTKPVKPMNGEACEWSEACEACEWSEAREACEWSDGRSPINEYTAKLSIVIAYRRSWMLNSM